MTVEISDLIKWLFFLVLLSIFATAAIYAFRGITGKEPKMTAGTTNTLLTSVIIATVTLILGIARKIDFFSPKVVHAATVHGGDPSIIDVQKVFDPHSARTNQLEILQKNPLPDLGGEWDYICTAYATNYRHGGICTIRVNKGQFGVNLEFNGTRTWRETWIDSKTNHTEKSLAWNSTWGAMTDTNHLQFTYIVNTGEGVICGYAWGNVSSKDGKGSAFDGNFYQLPPYNPLSGRLQFSRRDIAK